MEQRTQEELKAIEALEELSRQKSADIVPSPLPTAIQAVDRISDHETATASCPTSRDHLQLDAQSTTLDSDVETPVLSVPTSFPQVSQGNCQ